MLWLSLFLTLATCALSVLSLPDNESKSSNETELNKFNVQHVEWTEGKRTYRGLELEPPPNKLTVTEEIWFDFKIKDYYTKGKDYVARVTIGCFGDLTPVTCLNFISLAKGYRKGRSMLRYKGTAVHKIVRDFMLQMGDVPAKQTSGDSIYGPNFKDENFALSHSNAGWVGMANFGPDTNGSQFYVLLRSARWLDGKNVIFGKVITGMDVLRTIAMEETNKKSVPYRSVTINSSGVVGLSAPYTLSSQEFNTDEDIRAE